MSCRLNKHTRKRVVDLKEVSDTRKIPPKPREMQQSVRQFMTVRVHSDKNNEALKEGLAQDLGKGTKKERKLVQDGKAQHVET